jgi:hypothetical protein
MKACGVLRQPPRLPTRTMRASARASTSTALSTRSSTSSTSHSPSTRAALIVSSSGSPGPAPVRKTFPAGVFDVVMH